MGCLKIDTRSFPMVPEDCVECGMNDRVDAEGVCSACRDTAKWDAKLDKLRDENAELRRALVTVAEMVTRNQKPSLFKTARETARMTLNRLGVKYKR